MNNRLYKLEYRSKIQNGIWHSHDDLEITGYGPYQDGVFYIYAPNEHYVRIWWEDTIRYWEKERLPELIKIESLGNLRIITISS
jgi:hypothetical protein